MKEIDSKRPVFVFYIIAFALLLYVYATANGMVLPAKWKKNIFNSDRQVVMDEPKRAISPSPTSFPMASPTNVVKIKDDHVVEVDAKKCNDCIGNTKSEVLSTVTKVNIVENISSTIEEKVVSNIPLLHTVVKKPEIHGLVDEQK